MTHFYEGHDLFKSAITWSPWGNERIFNWHSPVVNWRVEGFNVHIQIDPPVKKTTIKAKSFYLEIEWWVQGTDQPMFVAPRSFVVDEGGKMTRIEHCYTLKSAIEIYRILERLWEKRHECERSKYMIDWGHSRLNTALNTVRFELLFGRELKECLVCREWSRDEVCPDCAYSEDEPSEASTDGTSPMGSTL